MMRRLWGLKSSDQRHRSGSVTGDGHRPRMDRRWSAGASYRLTGLNSVEMNGACDGAQLSSTYSTRSTTRAWTVGLYADDRRDRQPPARFVRSRADTSKKQLCKHGSEVWVRVNHHTFWDFSKKITSKWMQVKRFLTKILFSYWENLSALCSHFFFHSTAQLQYVEDSEPVTRSTWPLVNSAKQSCKCRESWKLCTCTCMYVNFIWAYQLALKAKFEFLTQTTLPRNSFARYSDDDNITLLYTAWNRLNLERGMREIFCTRV